MWAPPAQLSSGFVATLITYGKWYWRIQSTLSELLPSAAAFHRAVYLDHFYSVYTLTSSNQRLGVRSAAPVIIVVCFWIHYLYENGWSFRNRDDILTKSTIVLWIIWFLCFMVSKRRPIYWNSRWTSRTTIWRPLVTRCVTALVSVNSQVSRNICL